MNSSSADRIDTASAASAPCALVTGATGFAGDHLCRLLESRGERVLGLARTADESDSREMFAIDVRDSEAIASLISERRPSTVYHLAAVVETTDDAAITRLREINVEGTAAVASAIRAAGSPTRLVFTSSSLVYGKTLPDEQPVGETHALNPLTPYGASKAEAEQVVAEHVELGGDAIVARAFQHTGPGHVGAFALSEWALKLAELERNGGGVLKVGNLDVERDYLDVRDVVTAYVALAERGRSGAIYNVCAGSAISMRELLDRLAKCYRGDVTVEVDPTRMRASDQPIVVGDRSSIKADTGWVPKIPLERTLADLAGFARASLGQTTRAKSSDIRRA